VFGLKPTRARNPLGPDRGEGWGGFSCGHVVSISVRDSAAMLDAVHGPEPSSPYVAPPPERPFLQEVGRDPGRLAHRLYRQIALWRRHRSRNRRGGSGVAPCFPGSAITSRNARPVLPPIRPW
jgi:Asp-tRNA(Asn)/Glu-tRNA(Gln) amidotransferase A subunit family amidase